MTEFPLLSALIFIPLIGALFIYLSGLKAGAGIARNMALWTAVFNFILSLSLLAHFNPAEPGYQFTERHEWFDGMGYLLGIDGLSLTMIILTAFLMPICILASWESVESRVREYMILFLALESLIIGVFAAADFVLFYLFFEAVLIPMFLIIGIWGGERRVYAAFKFFLYTLAGSVMLLVALLYIYGRSGTMEIALLADMVREYDPGVQKWLWLAFFASFAVKVPMWPFHTWLPDAHVQAPTAGSVILAGVLLKLGAYGFLRFSLPWLPDASHYFAPMMMALSIVAIIYTSMVALVQTDMKKLIAYSSVAHMGFVTIGIFSFTRQGVDGAIFQMISHGLVSAALFLCVGVLYDRLHTKEIARYGGLAENMPSFAMVFMIFTMASVGLPGTMGFVGEFLSLAGIFQANRVAASLAATGVVLGACYMLLLYRRVAFGEIPRNDLRTLSDLETRERIIFMPIIALVVAFGIAPGPILAIIRKSVEAVIAGVGA